MAIGDLYILVALATAVAVAIGLTLYLTRGHNRAVDSLKRIGVRGGIASMAAVGSGDAKKDLKVLKFQRDLVGDALLRVYEASFITKEDKEYLLEKYKSELKELDKRIADYTAIVDISELENAREEIMKLMQVKVSQIDKKLEDLKKEYRIEAPKREVQVEHREQPAAVEDKVSRRKPQEEDRFTKLYDEVNDVLEKLEQIDVS